ncbi:MAG: DUF748 domain-containing protein [Gammaproteobacteria bacterium]|nr:DUF748 domain-containing protein [Gammaproteobacteria bacterium]
MQKRTTLMLRGRRFCLWIAGLLGTYSLLGFVLAPWVIERQLVALLQERANLQVIVEDIRLNPFTLTFSIDGLDTIDEDGKRLMSLEYGFVNLQLNSLTQRAVMLDTVLLQGLHFSVRRYSASDNNIARTAANWSASAGPAPDPAPPMQPTVIPRLLIADLRVEDTSLAFSDDVPSPPFFTTIDALDFAVQNLTTFPDATAGQTLSLTLGNGSQLHWSGTTSISPLRSEGDVTLRGPYPDLLYRYFRSQLSVRLEDGWLDSGFHYSVGLRGGDGLQAAVTDLHVSLSDLVVSDVASGSMLANLPLIALEGGALQWPQRRLSLATARLDGFDLRPERMRDGQINFLTLLPESTPEEPVPSVPAITGSGASAPWQLNVGQLALGGWTVNVVDRVPADPVALTLDIDATVDDISNAPDASMALNGTLNLSTGGALRVDGALTVLPAVRFDGDIALEQLLLTIAQPYLAEFANISIDDGRFSIAGEVGAAPGSLSYQGSLTLADLAVTDTVEQESLVAVERVQIDSLSVQAGERMQVDITDITVTAPYARVEIEVDGSTNIGRTLIVSESDQAVDETATAEDTVAEEVSAPLMPVTIQSIRIEQGSADFADRSLPLPFEVHMTDLRGQISALSTRSSEPARVSVEGQVDEFGQVTIGGQLRPLAFSEFTEIDMRFRNLDIPSMSPYIIKFAGRRIDEGALDVDLSYRINDSQLSGDNAMVMRDLVLGERVPHPDAMDLPLGLAVALLKDRNGVIDLEVPVSGDLNNPQFAYGSLIRNALANIITNIVAAPFRFLSRLIGGGDDEDMGVIGFLPGRADLSPPERQKLLRLATALTERPQLQLSITGAYASDEDTAVLREQFLARRIAMEMALAAQAPEQESVVVSRTTILENLYRAAQPATASGADPEAFLESLRTQHTRAATDSEPEMFDELAYSEALRRELLPLEPVGQADLEGLAAVRAGAVSRQLAATSPELAARIELAGTTGIDELTDGLISQEMELAAN